MRQRELRTSLRVSTLRQRRRPAGAPARRQQVRRRAAVVGRRRGPQRRAGQTAAPARLWFWALSGFGRSAARLAKLTRAGPRAKNNTAQLSMSGRASPFSHLGEGSAGLHASIHGVVHGTVFVGRCTLGRRALICHNLSAPPIPRPWAWRRRPAFLSYSRGPYVSPLLSLRTPRQGRRQRPEQTAGADIVNSATH